MNPSSGQDRAWQAVDGRVVRGHGVASGRGGDPRFPGGSLRMQAGPFLDRGLDLSAFHPGTVNVGIAPHTYRILTARHTFRGVKWHPTEPAEDFSFFDVRGNLPGVPAVAGLVYYPHPDTKPAHFQAADVLELLLPFVPGLAYDAPIRVQVLAAQIAIDR